MENERVSLQPAYVLHSRPYRDTSALVEVFTPEHGRLTLVARGARRRSRKQPGSGLPQPFTPLLVSFVGRTDLKTLTGRESAGATVALRGERLYSGLYVNELLVRLLHRHDPHPRLFAAYGQALAALGDVAVPLDGTLRRFELTLLDELGYRLQLDIASDGGRSVSHYRFDSELGLVGCSGADSSSTDRYPVDHLVAMSRGEFDGAARQSAKRLLRQALAVHLGDRPLHSRALFQQAVLPVADKPDNTGPGHRA